MKLPQLLEFDRPWRIAREITDHTSGQNARFEGPDAPSWQGALLKWPERGTLHHPSGSFSATRLYYLQENTDGIALLFADERLYHQIGPEAVHVCPPDLYRITMDFQSWPFWSTETYVSGPRKNYLLQSAYAPA